MCCPRKARRAAAVVAVAALVVVAGCAKKKAAPAKAQSIVPKLVLTVDGKPVEIPLEEMNVYLVKRGDGQETYDIHGTGVVLAGSFPPGVRVDYGEHWDVLVGKPVPISPRGGDRRDPEDSVLTLPGGTAWKVTGGTFTVTEVGEADDGATAVKGTIEIKCQTPSGEKAVSGTFAVKGHTWG